MCGRFALKTPPRSIQQHFDIPETIDLSPSYNIAPSQDIVVIRHLSGKDYRQLDMLRWGLIPGWAKDMKISYRMINARAETLAQKPSFRAAFKKRRCLIAADGFYEWRHLGKTKQPYFVHMKNGAVFGFAGLWESWTSPGGSIVESCTIITTSANDLVRKIHDRMPVILHPQKYAAWLNQESWENSLQPLLVPYPASEMESYRVSSEVNNPKNNIPACLQPL
ncbi:MAG: SOS response-associated peptidase [Deltaproteobacteria bacterium]|jgi:putative SOS response-associated peptidase YedK|nr:SOS response-associated peptidase [Deltaproteobacteria bacterium]